MRFNRPKRPGRTIAAETATESFDALIERAACFLMASSVDTNNVRAQQLMQHANDCMVEAAHSPFFGGTKISLSYEGLATVREEVFERVRDKLVRLGYPI